MAAPNGATVQPSVASIVAPESPAKGDTWQEDGQGWWSASESDTWHKWWDYVESNRWWNNDESTRAPSSGADISEFQSMVNDLEDDIIRSALEDPAYDENPIGIRSKIELQRDDAIGKELVLADSALGQRIKARWPEAFAGKTGKETKLLRLQYCKQLKAEEVESRERREEYEEEETTKGVYLSFDSIVEKEGGWRNPTNVVAAHEYVSMAIKAKWWQLQSGASYHFSPPSLGALDI